MAIYTPEPDLVGSDLPLEEDTLAGPGENQHEHDAETVDDDDLDTETTPDWRNRNVDLRRRYTAAEQAAEKAEADGDTAGLAAAKNELDRVGSQFYELNKGLALGVARRFAAGGDLHDYAGAAALGLWEAFLRWNPDRGVAFSTFSRQYIAGRVQRTVRQVEYNHLTQHEFNLRQKIRNAQTRLSMELERTPTHAEIAAAAGVPAEKVEKTLSTLTTSLETPIGDGTRTVLDMISDTAAPIYADDVEGLENLLEDLSDLELWIITARSDMLGGDPQSLVEIADRIGIGREIARRAETRGRLRLAISQFAVTNGRNPSVAELADMTGKDEDHVREYGTSPYADLKARWHRISRALTAATTAHERVAASARLDRFGEEFLSLMFTPRPVKETDDAGNVSIKLVDALAVELGAKRGDDTGDPIGSAEAAWLTFQAFLAWDADSGTAFPAWARRHVTAATRKAKNAEYVDDAADPGIVWPWIRRQVVPANA